MSVALIPLLTLDNMDFFFTIYVQYLKTYIAKRS